MKFIKIEDQDGITTIINVELISHIFDVGANRSQIMMVDGQIICVNKNIDDISLWLDYHGICTDYNKK